jgi:hypothetical protein
VIIQVLPQGCGKACGRRAGCVGAAAKVHGWSGLRRTCLAQEENEWWKIAEAVRERRENVEMAKDLGTRDVQRMHD